MNRRTHIYASTEVEIEDDLPLSVAWEFTPGEPAIISGPVEMCDPGCAPELVSCRVTTATGRVFPDGALYLVTTIGEHAFERAMEAALVDAEAPAPYERDYEWEPPTTAVEYSEDWA